MLHCYDDQDSLCKTNDSLISRSCYPIVILGRLLQTIYAMQAASASSDPPSTKASTSLADDH